MKRLFLFVRPPRPLWPFNGPSTAFWPPLAFASLAAALRTHVPGLEVQILDAPAIQMGWRSLAAELRNRQPAFVAIGEEAVSCVEGLRLAALARSLGAKVIAGGCSFAHLSAQILSTGLVDVVAHGEGELTIVELVQAMASGGVDALRQVAGISFLDGEEVVTTAPRALIEDLDRLPFPAYDLLPVNRYGRRSRNHPAFAAIEASRGCVGSCAFCVLWRQMGKRAGDKLLPHLRVKSPKRLLEEIRLLKQRFGREYLGWVDPSFNAHPAVPGRLAELLLSSGMQIGQSAWVRADGLMRDAASGALDACVRAGLNEVYIGVERPDPEGLALLGKSVSTEQSRQAFELLARRYPHVFTVGSFIYGLPGDTPVMMRSIFRQSLAIPMDKAFFIPLTPLPGTAYWRDELWDGTGRRLRHLDFLPPSGSKENARLDRTFFALFAFCWTPARIRSYVRGFFKGGRRKRRLTWRILVRATLFSLLGLLRSLVRRGGASRMLYPRWYEA